VPIWDKTDLQFLRLAYTYEPLVIVMSDIIAIPSGPVIVALPPSAIRVPVNFFSAGLATTSNSMQMLSFNSLQVVSQQVNQPSDLVQQSPNTISTRWNPGQVSSQTRGRPTGAIRAEMARLEATIL
jgi:hypothetical protein